MYMVSRLRVTGSTRPTHGTSGRGDSSTCRTFNRMTDAQQGTYTAADRCDSIAPCCDRRAVLAGISLSLLPVRQSKAALVDEESAVAVFQTVAPSVVTVEDYTLNGGRETFEGVGTGFVWSKLGHIVTNYHCISKVVRDQTGQSVRQ